MPPTKEHWQEKSEEDRKINILQNSCFMKLIDGKEISSIIKKEIAAEVAELIDAGKPAPHFAVILVGDDGASQTYVNSKEKSGKEVGFTTSVYRFPASITEKEVLETIKFINEDDEINGLLVQLPLPEHISEEKVIHAIDPSKDVDGFHPENIGKMVLGEATCIPATPSGIMELFKRADIETQGKNCVIIGRSHIVGSPMSILMSRDSNPGNATVTLCHSKTENLKEIAKQADILIVALGRPEFIDASYVKKGACVIDVGVSRVPDSTRKSGYKIVGDVKFDEVSKVADAITPVPGGVGPMTIAALLQNTLRSYKRQEGITQSCK